MDPVGLGPMNFESPPLVTVPLPLAGGGVGAARVTVTKGEFPPMTTDPPLGKIAETMWMPPAAFAPRKKGKVQLILGQDNAHLWPCPVAVSRDPVFSLQFLKSRIGGGLVYAGSLAAGWRSRRGITVAKNGALGSLVPKISALTMFVTLVSMCLASPAAACIGNRGVNTAWSHQDRAPQRHLTKWEDHSAARPSCTPKHHQVFEDTVKLQSGHSANHRSDFKGGPESSGGCGEMLRRENPGA
jgi:hypothetical protein